MHPCQKVAAGQCISVMMARTKKSASGEPPDPQQATSMHHEHAREAVPTTFWRQDLLAEPSKPGLQPLILIPISLLRLLYMQIFVVT